MRVANKEQQEGGGFIASIASQLARIRWDKVRYKNNQTLGQYMNNEGKKLYKCIKEEINAYYQSYSPKVYKRTRRFLQALEMSSVTVTPNHKGLQIEIYFAPELAYHPSVFPNGSPGYVPLLIRHGWQWQNDDLNIYRFTYFEGYDYIEKGIARYRASGGKLPVKVVEHQRS